MSEKPADRRLSGVGGRDRAGRRRGLSPGFAFPLFSPLFRALTRASGFPARRPVELSASGPRLPGSGGSAESRGWGSSLPAAFPPAAPEPAPPRDPASDPWDPLPRGLRGSEPGAREAWPGEGRGRAAWLLRTRLGAARRRRGWDGGRAEWTHSASTGPNTWAAARGCVTPHSVGRGPLAPPSAVAPIREALRRGHHLMMVSVSERSALIAGLGAPASPSGRLCSEAPREARLLPGRFRAAVVSR